MSEQNYWQRMRRSRMSRRALLRASSRAGVGAAGLALVGCGDDDDQDAPVAVSRAQQQQQQQDQPAAAQQADQQQQQQQAAEQQAQQADQQQAQAQQQQAEQQQAVQAAPLAREGDTDWERTVTVAVPNAVGGLDLMGPGNLTLKWNGPVHFDRLLQFDLVTREIVPHVGHFEWIEDFTAVLMHLNPGHAWHDGTPLTAEDIKFSAERAAGIAPYNESGVYETGSGYTVAAINGEVSVIDGVTARMQVKSEVTAPTSIGSSMPLVPKHLIEEIGDEAYNRVVCPADRSS